ncbi:hypothetical protein HYDPIDRAFT_170406 [Hydnomerulius pinastri MD-312]|uniref:Protein-S-isoprenylcysteine O-methyltransferase n=1 Tax=Hydnomerulius pinastri MD-312 TaxID=994086 RepID=A0A0C9W2E4_9AGAM|nr:hypothetical protein HYDPIDRAFT_170406 [Hydnomerulius pinastri MD-312]
MSFFRLPFVIGAAAGFHISVTAPETPANHERVKASSSEIIIQLMVKLLSLTKLISWAPVVAETVATISFHVAPELVPSLVQTARGPPTTSPGVMFIIASVFALAGGLLRLLCYRTLGRLFTFQLSVRKGHSLVTTGPYAYVRHPSYTGFIMCYIGIIAMHSLPGSWMRESGMMGFAFIRALVWSWVLIVGTIIFAGIAWRMEEEDRMLQRAFGEEWESWARKVKYRMLPGFY